MSGARRFTSTLSTANRLLSTVNCRLSTSLVLAVLGLGAPGCTMPKVLWSQRVWLNGRSFVFARINSLSEGQEGHRIDYRDGGFIVKGPGPIAVNGFEITAEDGVVVLANQRVELKPGEEVLFSSDMEWTVRPGPAGAPEPAPAPSPPASAAPVPATSREKGSAAAPGAHPPGPEKPSP